MAPPLLAFVDPLVFDPLVLLAGAACLLSTLAVCIVYRLRTTPEERERRRRLWLGARGRYRDGMLTDVQGDMLYYSYSVNAVAYATSQDGAALRHVLPEPRGLLVGPVTVRYAQNNPANSIVVCENWSGLRSRDGMPAVTGTAGADLEER